MELRACLPADKNRCTRTITCTDGERKGDQDICSKYLECKDGKWKKLECKSQEYFDTLDEVCKERQLAKPHRTCDRCQYTTKKWVNAVDEKCTNYLVCKEGTRVGDLGQCGENGYFNEEMQVCYVGSTTVNDYVRLNGACLCDWQCELDKCFTYACKEETCLNQKIKAHQAKCKISICDTANCQMQACDLHDQNADKLQCKKKICNENNIDLKEKINCKVNNLCDVNAKDCKIEICNEFTENVNEKVKCKIEACANDKSCQVTACEDYNLEEDVKNCKLDICKDGNCENTDDCDLDEKWQCELRKCDEIYKTEKGKVNCKFTHCNDNNCKRQACDTYTLASEKVECKQELCKTEKSPNNCLNEACNDHMHNIDDKVKCKLETCQDKDDSCKENICNTLKGKESLQCQFNLCENIQCCIDNFTNIDEQTQCKLTFLDDSRKMEICEDTYKDEKDKDELLACKISICKDIDCKHELCENSLEFEDDQVQCKVNTCDKDNKCKINVCHKYPNADVCKVRKLLNFKV